MAFHEKTVIEALADKQFLPRYGFPIGLLRLRVLAVTESDKPDGKPYVREEDQYRLERPGILAMREYVPGATFFVGNKVVTSHGLLKHWTGENLNSLHVAEFARTQPNSPSGTEFLRTQLRSHE